MLNCTTEVFVHSLASRSILSFALSSVVFSVGSSLVVAFLFHDHNFHETPDNINNISSAPHISAITRIMYLLSEVGVGANVISLDDTVTVELLSTYGDVDLLVSGVVTVPLL